MWALLAALKGLAVGVKTSADSSRRLERMLGSTVAVVLAVALVLVFTRVEANFKSEQAALELRITNARVAAVSGLDSKLDQIVSRLDRQGLALTAAREDITQILKGMAGLKERAEAQPSHDFDPRAVGQNPKEGKNYVYRNGRPAR